jgi:hypothetical protein
LTATPSETPTHTPTSTSTPPVTPSQTPTETPNAVCPTFFTFNDPSPNPLTIPNQTMFRLFSASGLPFNFGYTEFISNTQQVFRIGTAPDGNNYPVFSGAISSANYLLTRNFFSTTDQGFSVQEIAGLSTYPLITGVTINGDIAWGLYDVIFFDGTQFPPNGVVGFPNGIGGGDQYLTYPEICPTPTPTQTSTKTPTPTTTTTLTSTPTQTPSNTPTLTSSNTPTLTQTPSNTPTLTQTPTQTRTPNVTPSNTPTNTLTPSNTPTTSTVFNYYRVYLVEPSGPCQCGAECLRQIRTIQTWTNDNLFHCITYNGVSGYKAKYFSTTISGNHPVAFKTGSSAISCNAVSC